MAEEEVSSETETSENSSSDDAKPPINEATNYEKQRQSRIAQNKARMEAFGLHKIAKSLMDSSQKSWENNSKRKSKRVVEKSKEDDEYEPNDDEEEHDDDDGSDSNLDSSSEEFEENKKRKKKKANVNTPGSEKVKNRKLRSGKQISLQKQLNETELMDEDEAVKQAIALSLKDFGETSDLQYDGSLKDQASRTNEKRKKKFFKSREQMTEDGMVINFCQFDEVGKGSITLRDVQRMAASHDFTWTEKELKDMIRCFDSDRDGKLSLDDFRNIVQRCNMLQVPENS